MDSVAAYSVPVEAQKVLEDHILKHPGHKNIPTQLQEYSKYVKYVGSDQPRMAINWRLAESVAALKGFEAILINQLLVERYNIQPQEIFINTDHTQLFLMSALVCEVDPEDVTGRIRPTELRELTIKHARHFPNWDLHEQVSSSYRKSVTNIYKCRDGRYVHMHASLNPDPSLAAAHMPRDMPEFKDMESSWAPFIDKMAEKDAVEWDETLGETAKQAATICYTAEEFATTEQGKATAHVGLYEIHTYLDSEAKPGWWEPVADTSVRRPLAGLKIIDLTRIIAGPSIGRSLAELGASVMRITAPNIADFSGLHPDLNWGKWNCHLDLKTEEGRTKLRKLLIEADVVINGYRPFVLDKYGVGFEDVFRIGRERGRGFIYVRENCFGWHGPWSHRSGWQPISDACCGVSMGFGRAMGNDEPVTPVLPNSDYCTGIAGSCAVLEALVLRAKQGGSYLIDSALNYYNRWLTEHVGEYPSDVWNDVWTRNGRKVFRHYHNMSYLLPRYMDMFQEQGLLDLDFFEVRTSKALGDLKIRIPKPVHQFPAGMVELGYNVGTRGNGVDQPRWPHDLNTEVVA